MPVTQSQNQQHRIAGMKAVADQEGPIASERRQKSHDAGGIGKMKGRQRMQSPEFEQNLGCGGEKCTNNNQPGWIDGWPSRVFRHFGERGSSGGTAHEFGSPGSSPRITVDPPYNGQ